MGRSEPLIVRLRSGHNQPFNSLVRIANTLGGRKHHATHIENFGSSRAWTYTD
jgi:hypothetical protein